MEGDDFMFFLIEIVVVFVSDTIINKDKTRHQIGSLNSKPFPKNGSILRTQIVKQELLPKGPDTSICKFKYTHFPIK